MTDDLDRRLHADATKWQAEHDGSRRSLELARSLASPRDGGRRTLPLVAAASVVIVAVGLGVAMTTRGGGTRQLGASPNQTTLTPTVKSAIPTASSAMPTPTGSPDPLRPSVPPEVKNVTPAKVPIVVSVPGAVSMPWRLLGLGTQSLDIEYEAGDNYCVVPVGATVEYGTSAVSVEVISRVAHSGSCGSAGVLGRGLIELSQPLGGRALLHVAVDPAWKTFP